MARTQDGELLHTLQKAFDYIENESFASTFQGLFSKINLSSEKLGKQYTERNAKLCTIITKIAASGRMKSTKLLRPINFAKKKSATFAGSQWPK